jgi:uncharacterized membrane protein (DUF373 family)
MADGGDERESPPSGRARRFRRLGRRAGGVTRSIRLLEHAQDVVTVGIGAVLLAVAATILVSGVAGFVHSLSVAKVLSAESVTAAAVALLDEVLLVLILIEILHTVVLSLRSHRLLAEPFIVVGLVAVIREILFVLTGEKQLSTSVLALLIAMVAVFIAGLVVISRFERNGEPDLADGSHLEAHRRVQGGRRRIGDLRAGPPAALQERPDRALGQGARVRRTGAGAGPVAELQVPGGVVTGRREVQRDRPPVRRDAPCDQYRRIAAQGPFHLHGYGGDG